MPNLRGIRSAIGLHVGVSAISVLLVSLPTMTAAQTAALYQFAAVQIVPRGDRVFPIETASADHAAIVVRRVSNGDIVATIDPCAACT